MMIKKTILLAILACVGLSAQARERLCFDKGWRFILADTAAMATPEYHDASWRQLDVPHDWAIEGDFFVGNPSGAGGGALPGGIGWYRKTDRRLASVPMAIPASNTISLPMSMRAQTLWL